MAARGIVVMLALLLAAGGPIPEPRPVAPRAASPAIPVATTARPAGIAMPRDARVRLLGAIALRSDDPAFGGLSGVGMDGDGMGFVAVSDRGAFFEGRLVRDADRLTGLADLRRRPLRDARGIPRPPGADDAEALARGPDGAVHVAFERDHRVWRYDAPDGKATELPRAPGFAALPFNAGIEALAVAPDGTLVAIAEESGRVDAPFPMFRRAPGAAHWTRGGLPRDGLFLVTGADFGPDGLLYLLERDYAPLRGVAMRLRRVDLAAVPLRPEVLVEIRNGGIDNMEGVAVWRDGAGRIRVLLVSDDNFSPLQRTLFVEFAVE